MGDGARARPGRRTARGGGHGVVKFLLGLVALLAVIGGILSFVDIGGDLILGVAKEQLKKQARLELTAEGVRCWESAAATMPPARWTASRTDRPEGVILM